jgi:acyl dehydratase
VGKHRPVGRYFEDWTVGERLETGSFTLMEDRIIAFARDYDPQIFHLDPEAAKSTIFGRLVASGWQTAAVTMRLIVESGIFGSHGGIGLGVDELRWLKPVFANDTLRVEVLVTRTRANPDKPSGVAHFAMKTLNQDGDPVMTQTAIVMLPRRPTGTRA